MYIIIGAGISGLTLGYYLQKQNIPYQIIESSSISGGNIQTLTYQGRVLELGPNTIVLKPHIETLLQELRLEQEILFANPSAKKRYILKENQYKALPSNPFTLLFGTFFSTRTKVKILKDLFKKPNPTIPDKENVHDFFVRHFGLEIAELVVNPFVSGIYAGDSQKLVTEYAFPTLIEAEKNTGSILKGFIKYQKEHRSKGIISFKNGLHTLIKALHQAQDKNILLHTSIEKITFNNNEHYIYLSSDEFIKAQKIIFTIPAYATARYIHTLSETFAHNIASIPYAPVCVVHSIYPKNKVKHKLDGFGALHPSKYNTFTLGTIFNSTLFSHRAKTEEVLLTTFIGGQKFLPLSEKEIQLKTHQELAKYLGINAEPTYTHVKIWEKAIPQYEAIYADILPHIHSWEEKGIYFSGNWLNGISVEKCIEFNQKLAQRLAH